ncbi:MAG: hypothetical protein ACRCR7_13270, partial [Weissella cibaria]
IAALITGLTFLYTKFEAFRNGINFILNGLIAGFEVVANAHVRMTNTIIAGINKVSPFKDISPVSEISLGRVGGGGAPVSGGGAAREGGTGSITPALPSMPMLPAPITGGIGGGGGGSSRGGGGGGGGVGGGGDLVQIQGGLTTVGMAERIAARNASPVTINVTGGIATSAEIGQSVLNSLLAYQRTNGPLDLMIAE